MASYRAVNGVLLALEYFFKTRLPPELENGPVNGSIEVIGSAYLAEGLSGNVLAIYVHRAINPHGRSRFFALRAAIKMQGRRWSC